MDSIQLHNAAKEIVRHNVSQNVCRVGVQWNAHISRLTLVYYFDGTPSNDDLEMLELSMTELLAEFPDIASAECEAHEGMALKQVEAYGENIVYVRPA